MTVGLDLIGGSISGADSLDRSGYIIAGARIPSVTIGGSIVSGIDNSTGALTNNATIRSGADLGALSVAGSLIGNRTAAGDSPVIISALGRAGLPPGAPSDLTIGSVTIRGSVESRAFSPATTPLSRRSMAARRSAASRWAAHGSPAASPPG